MKKNKRNILLIAIAAAVISAGLLVVKLKVRFFPEMLQLLQQVRWQSLRSDTGEQIPGTVEVVSNQEIALTCGRLVRSGTVSVQNPGGLIKITQIR